MDMCKLPTLYFPSDQKTFTKSFHETSKSSEEVYLYVIEPTVMIKF